MRQSLSRHGYLLLPALAALACSQAAHASQCFTNGPRYQLESDTVEWRMTVRSSENCVRGVRFSYVYNADVSLISQPQHGHVSIVGIGFSYTAKPEYHGEDSFVVGVSGSKKKTSGFSTIRVMVSVISERGQIKSTFAHFDAN
jgi:hypothetical protein